LTLTNEEIVDMLDGYEKETKALRREALKLSWSMRGGVTYDDVMALSSVERTIIVDIINENLETTKKSGLPYF
jgi:hypothetical protein